MRLTLLLPVFLCACATVAPDAPPARLAVTSEPAGALAVLTLQDGTPQQSCVTPCGFSVPANATFHVGFAKDGYVLTGVSAPRWRVRDGAATLVPNQAHATLMPSH